ncbi:FGGY-family carbohydrate kinase [Flavihumibacter petaseus]|uniref:Putative carbohydrate kinase n=1 Tax=Flavihumibacter petaseus NBRC 106054 TaxID=1220578 RepID=A0A0E9MX78_9BACT|nr:FGGY family carbohydrate kinase [Flavihumibacter petaseus]GAO42016.1 putative carbohydrate kinase [Flavihumibacter petaseus NBRC 106054]
MAALPVIAVFDVGKTNKKLFLFDSQYRIVEEITARFTETTDEDGFPCDNLESFRQSITENLSLLAARTDIDLRVVNFTTYGASMVYIDENGDPLTPLYNYLKPYPEALAEGLYERYGGKDEFSRSTASPAMGNLNSGLQLYRIKIQQPEIFRRIRYALHLPQYLHYLVAGSAFSDLTSIGCHTALWDMELQDYHTWVREEQLDSKLAPVCHSSHAIPCRIGDKAVMVGVGLHDSSAALIPYLRSFSDPFVLLSTGTWGITLNPFNQSPLTLGELESDCLFYLSYKGLPVKASRYFTGRELEQRSAGIAEKYKVSVHSLHQLPFDGHWRNAGEDSVIKAYHQLMQEIVDQQAEAMRLVIPPGDDLRIYIDGGFSRNEPFLRLLAGAFPRNYIAVAEMAQATSLGAALVMHDHWNGGELPADLVKLHDIRI